MNDESEIPSLTIQPTPAVSVFLNEAEEITVSVTRMSSDLDRIEESLVSIPLQNAESVAAAILAIVKNEN